MRVLITGIGGFAGSHLAEHLLAQPGLEVWGTVLNGAGYAEALSDRLVLRTLDLTDAGAVRTLLDTYRPERIYHLAASSVVGSSWENPWPTLENNIRAQLNLLHGLVELELESRILCVSSAEIYGRVAPEELPIDEEAALRPESPYGVSKVTQDMLAYQYFRSYGLFTIRARPANHIGPRQSPGFVGPAFAQQIAEIEAGLRPPVMQVGNLTAQRDFTDVHDMVRAYHLLLERGEAGEAYNIGSGVPRAISQLLDFMLAAAQVEIDIQEDPERMRPSDVPVSYVDASKARGATGWTRQIPFEQSVLSVLEDWRQRVRDVTYTQN